MAEIRVQRNGKEIIFCSGMTVRCDLPDELVEGRSKKELQEMGIKLFTIDKVCDDRNVMLGDGYGIMPVQLLYPVS